MEEMIAFKLSNLQVIIEDRQLSRLMKLSQIRLEDFELKQKGMLIQFKRHMNNQ